MDRRGSRPPQDGTRGPANRKNAGRGTGPGGPGVQARRGDRPLAAKESSSSPAARARLECCPMDASRRSLHDLVILRGDSRPAEVLIVKDGDGFILPRVV